MPGGRRPSSRRRSGGRSRGGPSTWRATAPSAGCARGSRARPPWHADSRSSKGAPAAPSEPPPGRGCAGRARARTVATPTSLGPEVRVADDLGRGELPRRAAPDDLALLKQEAVVGDLEGLSRVLLDQEDRRARLVD